MNCFLKCIINKPRCLICHENIVLNKTVIEYILNIFTNNNVMIKLIVKMIFTKIKLYKILF